MTGNTSNVADYLQTCTAVAEVAQSYGKKIAVISADEELTDGYFRPVCEDLTGSGAILSYLNRSLSPEA